MIIEFLVLKRERDISIKPMFSGEKSTFRSIPALIEGGHDTGHRRERGLIGGGAKRQKTQNRGRTRTEKKSVVFMIVSYVRVSGTILSTAKGHQWQINVVRRCGCG